MSATSNDFRVRILCVMILKNLGIDARWVVLAQMRGDLDGAVDHVIVLDISADESDDDDGRRRNRVGCIDQACRSRTSGGWDKAKKKRNSAD